MPTRVRQSKVQINPSRSRDLVVLSERRRETDGVYCLCKKGMDTEIGEKPIDLDGGRSKRRAEGGQRTPPELSVV